MTTESKQIKKIEADIEELKSLAVTAKKMVVTKATIKDADRFRIALKNKRLDIQKQEKYNNDILKEMKRLNEERAEELINLIAPAEKELEAKIKAIEDEEKRIKEEAEKKERERIATHRKNIADIEATTAFVRTSMDSSAIEKALEMARSFKDRFEEFNQEGNEAIMVLEQAAENRMAYISEIAKKVVGNVPPEHEKENSPLTPREKELWGHGYKKGEYAWTKGAQSIPFSLLSLPDDAWKALLSAKSGGAPKQESPISAVTGTKKTYPEHNVQLSVLDAPTKEDKPKNSDYDFNVFEVKGYGFGIDKKVPIKNVISLRKVITSEMEKW